MNVRIIPCSCCGGDGGGFEGGNERWISCAACDGKGEFEAELEPVTQDDLDEVPPGLALLSRERKTMSEIRKMTVEELAEDAFLKQEYLKAQMMANTPSDFEERKKAFVRLAMAREASNKARAALDAAERAAASRD